MKQISMFQYLLLGNCIKVIIKGFSAMAKGHVMGVPEGDVRQLPGVFVINTDGQVEFSHYAENPADHLDPDAILEILHSLY
jgi:hypothetical protein